MLAALPDHPTEFDRLAFARAILNTEAEALQTVASRLGAAFEACIDVLAKCVGRIAVVGVGKSADIGQKIVGTMNSTGTRAYLLDATRAMHGDLGMIHPDDCVLVLSHSGESDELIRLLPSLHRMASKVLAITGNVNSTLARKANSAIVYGPIREACPLALAPSSSTTAMLALGDALAFTLSEMRAFTPDQFAQYHPAGSLGRKLANVEQYMRRGEELRIAPASDLLQTAFVEARRPGRRTGAMMLIHDDGTLAGLFTDSDLARLLERREFSAFDRPIAEVMTKNPFTIRDSARMSEALNIFTEKKISELPVVDEQLRPIGLLDITDLIGIEPDVSPTQSPIRLRILDNTLRTIVQEES